MKVVNPIGRTVETVNSYANYVSPLGGCVCSGPDGTAATYRLGDEPCLGYCEHGATNRHENYEMARDA